MYKVSNPVMMSSVTIPQLIEGEQRWHAGGRIDRVHHTDGAVDEACNLAAVQSDILGTVRREYVHLNAAMQDAAKASGRPGPRRVR